MSWKQWLVLLAVFSLYLLFGGVVLMNLESPAEESRLNDSNSLRNTIYEKLIGSIANKSNNEEIRQRENDWVEIAQTLNLHHLVRNNTLPEKKWTLFNSFFVAITAASTIGYGHLAPSTTPGRIFCIVFALFGIPLNGILFATLGDYFGAKLVRRSDKRSTRRLSGFFIILADVVLYTIPGMIIFLAIPAGVFSAFEGWDYIDSFYYAFISLTTIGFGDLVAGQNDIGRLTWLYRFGIIIWIFFGLGYLMMVINIITKGMRSRTLAQLEKKMVARFRATRNALAQDGESLRHLVNQIKLLKPIYIQDKNANQRTVSQPTTLPGIREEIHMPDAVELDALDLESSKKLSSSDTALTGIDNTKSNITPHAYCETQKDPGRMQEDPVELLNRLATVLCEVLDADDSTESECAESEGFETTQSDVADQQDAKPESAFERIRRSLRRLSSNTIHHVSTQSEIKDKSYDSNVSPSNSAKRQFIFTTHNRRMSDFSHPQLSLVDGDFGNDHRAVMQESLDRPVKKRTQRSFSECHSPSMNGEYSHGFQELIPERFSGTVSRSILSNGDETAADNSISPMSLEEFCVILDQVQLPSNKN